MCCLWDDFVPCPSLLSFQVPTAGSLLHAELSVSLFHAGAALIEAVNQLAGAVDINDGCNEPRGRRQKKKKKRRGKQKEKIGKKIAYSTTDGL